MSFLYNGSNSCTYSCSDRSPCLIKNCLQNWRTFRYDRCQFPYTLLEPFCLSPSLLRNSQGCPVCCRQGQTRDRSHKRPKIMLARLFRTFDNFFSIPLVCWLSTRPLQLLSIYLTTLPRMVTNMPEDTKLSLRKPRAFLKTKLFSEFSWGSLELKRRSQ